VGILIDFLHIYYTFLSTLELQVITQLSPTMTKLCHNKLGYLVHIICSKCPPSAETHVLTRLRVDSFVDRCLWQVTKNKHFYNVNKHVGYDMTSTVTSFAQ